MRQGGLPASSCLYWWYARLDFRPLFASRVSGSLVAVVVAVANHPPYIGVQVPCYHLLVSFALGLQHNLQGLPVLAVSL